MKILVSDNLRVIVSMRFELVDIALSVCSDGVWEFLSSKEVGEVIAAGHKNDVRRTVEAIAKGRALSNCSAEI